MPSGDVIIAPRRPPATNNPSPYAIECKFRVVGVLRCVPLRSSLALALLHLVAQRPPTVDHLVDVKRFGEHRWQVADCRTEPVGEHALVVVLDDLAHVRLGPHVSEGLRVARRLLAQGERSRQGTAEIEVLTRGEPLDPPVRITGVAEIESVRERMGMAWLVIRTDVRTDQDELVASTYSTILVREEAA